MALVDSHHFTEHLHGSIELIEDTSQMPASTSQSIKVDLETAKAEKEQIVLVTVERVDSSTGSRPSSLTDSDAKVSEESELAAPMNTGEKPALSREASRRYSVMMASLAAARVEECKANLRRNSTASPANSGIPAGTVKGGWDWTPRRDLEEDFAVRERYFAEEL